MLGALAGAGVLALVAPRTNTRHEERHLDVQVSASASGGMISIFVRARNLHAQRRRVYTASVDVSESLAAAGRLELSRGGAPPRWVPFARVWRVPFDEEIAPGESRDLGLRIASAKPGRYEGAVDVVLDGTTWVRETVVVEVPERRSGSGREEDR